MTFVDCLKSAHAISQNQSRGFWLPGNNESVECIIRRTHGKSVFSFNMTINFVKVDGIKTNLKIRKD